MSPAPRPGLDLHDDEQVRPALSDPSATTLSWEAAEEGFTDGDGSRPWVYVVPPAKVIAFGKEPHSQTTYRPGAS